MRKWLNFLYSKDFIFKKHEIPLWTKMVIEEAPEFPFYHEHIYYTDAHGKVLFERNAEISWMTSIHSIWMTEKIPTSKQVGKAEIYSPCKTAPANHQSTNLYIQEGTLNSQPLPDTEEFEADIYHHNF